MRKLMYVLLCLCVMSVSVSAEIIAFNAESSNSYIQAGTAWDTVSDENALGGKCITGNVDLPAQTEDSTRIYAFAIPVGTYDLYMRINQSGEGGQYVNDSFYMSDSTLEQTTTLGMYNGLANPGIDDVATVDNFGWILIDTDYVMAETGLGYLTIQPREDGLFIDAFAFVSQGDEVTNEMLNESVVTRGIATDPVPESGDTEVDSVLTTSVSWSAPVDVNLVEITGYDVYFGTYNDPNMTDNPMVNTTETSIPVSLDYNTTYYWRVDTYVTWDTTDVTGNLNDIIEGETWILTTLPDNKTPKILLDNVLTSVEYLPASLSATVDDWGENDIASITWELLDAAGADSKQMLVRTDQIGNLEGLTDDPNMLMDWIGIDIRDNKLLGNPMVLTLSGLPAGSYTWKSYHHDAENQTGMFDVKVEDSIGSKYFSGVDISNGTDPVTTLETMIESNGTDPVTIYFHKEFASNELFLSWFVMNGFELSNGSDSLLIDFDGIITEIDEETQEETTYTYTMPGWESYQATNEVSETFTEQSYSAFGASVSVAILPTWGAQATLEDTTNSNALSQTAVLNTEWSGLYQVQVTATDSAGQSDSEIMEIRIAADACEAAQLDTSWSDFSVYDANADCKVDLIDFAEMSTQWMDDRLLDGQK